MAREGLMDDCGYEPYVDEDAWNDGFKEGFLKAVDEFVERIKAHTKIVGTTYLEDIDKIAEELKKGE